MSQIKRNKFRIIMKKSLRALPFLCTLGVLGAMAPVSAMAETCVGDFTIDSARSYRSLQDCHEIEGSLTSVGWTALVDFGDLIITDNASLSSLTSLGWI